MTHNTKLLSPIQIVPQEILPCWLPYCMPTQRRMEPTPQPARASGDKQMSPRPRDRAAPANHPPKTLSITTLTTALRPVPLDRPIPTATVAPGRKVLAPTATTWHQSLLPPMPQASWLWIAVMRSVCRMTVLLRVNLVVQMTAARAPARRTLLAWEISQAVTAVIKMLVLKPVLRGLRARTLPKPVLMALEAQPNPRPRARASRMTKIKGTARKMEAVDSASSPNDGVVFGLHFGNAATTTNRKFMARADPVYFLFFFIKPTFFVCCAWWLYITRSWSFTNGALCE